MEAGSNINVRNEQTKRKVSSKFTFLPLRFAVRFVNLTTNLKFGYKKLAGICNPIPFGFLFLFLFSGVELFAQTSQIYTTNGSFTVPAGVTSITVECWGAGGGGSKITNNGLRGGGGGGGAFASSTMAVSGGTVYNFIVGTGGIANTAGGNTIFIAGQIEAAGGKGGTNNSNTAGAGGTAGASFGTTKYSGGNGADGGGTSSGGGGGGAGTAGAGGNATGATAGTGTTVGGGSGGAGVSGSSNGLPGSNNGGGGSGAVTNNSTDRTGGSGANGAIRITWCPIYSISTTSASSVCINNSSVVSLTSTAAGLPVGSYTVTYNLSGANVALGASANMNVITAGQGSFNTMVLATSGSTTITITNITSGPCSTNISANNTSTFTVSANHTLTLTSAASTTNQTVCPGVAISKITYSTGGGATSAAVSGLPAGVSGSFTAGVFTISGVPTTSGSYSYTVTTTGNSCTVATATGTITVSPGIPAKPGAISGTATVCASTSGLIYSIAAVPNATTYTWTVPAGWTINSGQGSTSISVSSGTVGQNGNITVTAGNSCGTSTLASSFAVTVITFPAIPDAISGTATVCATTSGLIYSIAAVPNASSYTWTVPAGWTINSGQGTISISVTSGTVGQNGNITVSAKNACGTSTSTCNFAVTVITFPAIPGAITGAAIVCNSTSDLIYSIAAVPNATTYTWTVPAGWSINSGQGTTSISVTSGSLGQNGNITVTAGNSCGTSASASIFATVVALPSQPGAISPSTPNVCQGATLSYMVMPPPPSGVTYTWSGPAGSTVLTGQGTNIISITYGNTSGNLTVTPSNACGNGPAQTMAINITLSAPATPSIITGTNAPCIGSTQSYSVLPVIGVTYFWVVPIGWTINAGQGTNIINVTVGNNPGNVSVNAGNACGNSAPRTLAVTPQAAAPAIPSAITGGTQVCIGSVQTYSVTNIAFVTYTWSLPAGWVINSGQGTNTIQVTVGANSGNISVTPSNECGNGPAQSKAVTVDLAIPTDPGNINGQNNPCESSTQIYSVTYQAGVSYVWSVPLGSTIASGQGTASISVTIGPNSGNVAVSLSNSCGSGPNKTLGIVVRPLPSSSGAILGSTLFCEGTIQTYSVTLVAGNTYNWTVPVGWSINAGQGSNSITVTTGINSGNVQVIPVNSCGSGPASTLAVTVNPLPAAFVGADKTICKGASVQLGGLPVPGNTYSWTSFPVGFVSSISNPVVTPDDDTEYTLVETNTITGCSKSNSVQVTSNQVISVTITPSVETICTGEATHIVVTSNISYTTFTWDPVLSQGTGTSGFSSGSGPNIVQTITNTSSALSIVKYTVTAMANECVNNESAIEVFINPAPVVAGSSKTLCSNIPTSVTFAASSNGVLVQNYTITNIQSNGLTASAGAPAIGSGLAANVIADDAWTNTTTAPVHVIYTVLPVSSVGCAGAAFTVDITVNPKPVITNSSTKSICSGTSTAIALTSSIAATFSWTIGTITGGITGASASSGNTINQVLTNPSSTLAGTVQYNVTPLSTVGSCTGIPFVITVTVNPTPVITNPSSIHVCSGSNTNINILSGTPSTYSWTIGAITGGITGAAAGNGSTISQVLINPSNATPGTVNYLITPTAIAGGCVGAVFTLTVTVDPIPSVSAGSSPSSVCPGVPFNLTSSSSLTFSATDLLAEKFNSATNTWLKENISTGGTVANAAWTLRADNYTYNTNTFHSNDNSQFYMSNSDAQGSGSTTDTRLRTPALNTIGYTSLFLDFYHHFQSYPNSTGKVEVSTDGATWTTIATNTANVGASNNFISNTIDLSLYIEKPTLYIRFRYQATYGWYWAIDNVTVRGTVGATQPVISWNSNPSGFTSSQALPSNVLQGETTTYTVSYTNPISGCKNSASTTVTSLVPPTASIVADYCKVPGKIQLTASGGGSYLWSTGAITQVIVVDIAGIYSVTVTGANGCSSVANLNVSTDLVVNGNFSAGNTGFTSGYANDQTANGLYCCESEYAVNSDALYTHTNFHGFDHTSGTGTGNANFLIVNGAKYAPQPYVWGQTVTVLPNTDYYFSAYAISLNDVKPFASLRFEVNGTQVGTTAILTTGTNSNANPWKPADRFYGTWNSGAATTASIKIIDLETAAGGNDFGIDDISFGTLSPVPFSFAPSANLGTNLVCEGQPLQLNANITGGMSPYVTTWTGPNGFTSTAQNPLINSAVLASQGTYTLKMHDSYGCTDQTKTVNVIVNPAPTATAAGGGNVCQYGASPVITFTANGGTPPYTFTYNIDGGANQTISTLGTDNSVIFFAPTTALGTFIYNIVNVVDSKGCPRDVSASTTVVVNPLPVSSISGNNPVCPGSMGNIYTGNAGMNSYNWSISGNGNISGVSNDIIVDVNAGDDCGKPFDLVLKVTDNKGCGAMAIETVMVDDNINPVIHTCPADVTYIGTSTSVITPLPYSSTLVTITEFEFTTEGGLATDNCEIDTYSYIDTQSGTSPILVVRKFSVTDKCGNVSGCFQNITILSDPPDITCSGAVSVNADANQCSAVVNPVEPTINAGAPVTLSWVMTGATIASGSGAIGNYTFNVGVTTITWTATNASGTDVCEQTITVIDNQKPTFSIPTDKSYCVETIILADYWDPTIDITPNRPDYYTFVAGKIDLDLVTGTFIDNCPNTCGFEIRWRIEFEDGSTLPAAPLTYLTGQISTYGSNILFPGKIAGDAVHTVVYKIVDCHGNVSDEQSILVTIKPRPNVIKLN